MSVAAVSELTPSDLLVTDELLRRRTKRPHLQAEVDAFQELGEALVACPDTAIQRFLELALSLCNAGSSGLSLLSFNEAGEKIFRWDALAGEFAGYVGGTTPRDFSPCGLCLDAQSTILIARPARVFEYFNQAHVPIVEGLIVPLYDTARVPLGTLWVVSHDERRFEANDARIMEQLAIQLVLALKFRAERRSHQDEIHALESRVAAKDSVIQEIHHRVKNTIAAASAILRLQSKTALASEAKELLDEAQARLTVFARVHELLYRTAASGQEVPIVPLLTSLTESLQTSFADRSQRVDLQVEAELLSINPDEAIPLALIVNEAVTNAYKHAFPQERSGRIEVRLERTAGLAHLTVRDDGVGMPPELATETLGMRLMRSFARQLGADLVINTRPGTSLSVTFPLAEV